MIAAAMLEDQTRKKARKGTKSCTECRRRKVRCIRVSEDAPICRRCEERGSTCTPQVYSTIHAIPSRRLPSRQRISQLESKVASLAKVVRSIEQTLGHQSALSPEPYEESNSDAEDSEESSVVDVPVAEQPSHLRSLFQNDWLSVDTKRQTDEVRDRKTKATTQLLNVARQALQKLIPSRETFVEMASYSSRWLWLIHTLLPQPFAIINQQELLTSYDDIQKSDVDPISLATVLLTLAITAQQDPQSYNSPETQSSKHQNSSSFCRTVSDAVESTILSHDRLVGTVKGLGMAMHYLRLQITLEYLQKAWIKLRHFIAIAELMGLPKASQAVEVNKLNGVDDETTTQKAQLWESLCSADRLFAMVINLPPGTQRYQQTKNLELVVDGVVQTRAYVSKLTAITAKIQELDDLNMIHGPKAELYTSTLKIDRELKELASRTPKSWWTTNNQPVRADNMLRFLHYCASMRIHLPFTIQQDPGEEYIYSRLACTNACEAVADAYQFLRQGLPPGIFVSRLLDLQALSASVVLLLTSHGSPSTEKFNLRSNKARIDTLVTSVIKIMDERSECSNFAQHSATTIRSLQALLQQDDDTPHMQQLTLKVPLIGSVHIRRNVNASEPLRKNAPQTSQNIPTTEPLKTSEYDVSQSYGHLPVSTDGIAEPSIPLQQGWQWDPLSWSIDNYNENFFQDAIMTENFEDFDLWQNDQGFQFGS